MTDTENGLAVWMDEQFVLDQFTPLDYKGVLSTRRRSGMEGLAPDWMGTDRRRVQGYTALQAYIGNAARGLMRITNGEDRDERDQRREYGDAKLLVEQIRAALVGDQQTIAVSGASDYDPSDEDQENAEARTAWERQEFLRQWAEDERFLTKLIETERNAVSMGDGVYSLGWDSSSRRVRLRTWDPSAYFPVLEDRDEDEYPRRVHLAWELEDDVALGGLLRIRRITYDLRDVEPYRVPWKDEPVTKSCFMTDAVFTVDRMGRSPDDLTWKRAEPMTDALGEIVDRDLGIDFIPVIHIPNTVAIAAHFGQSSLLNVLQILDDIQATDSDLQSASALTGGPMLALSGGMIDDSVAVGPRRALKLGPNGRVDVISGSEGLAAQADYRDDLLRRLSVNSRVPEAVLGRVDPSRIQAGIVLSLSFGPLASLIEEMRLVRRDKYRLLLKFVQRFYLKQGSASGGLAGRVIDADLLFGSYLPSDQAGTVSSVVQMVNAKVISRATAMKMLQEVGVPITDLPGESKAIDAYDFAGAAQLLDALGSDQAVADYLGVAVPTDGRPDQNQVTETLTPTQRIEQAQQEEQQ